MSDTRAQVPLFDVDVDAVASVREHVENQLSVSEVRPTDVAAAAKRHAEEGLRLLLERRSRLYSDPMTDHMRESVIARVMADLFGLGGIDILLEDQSIENIFVNGFDDVHVARRNGERETLEAQVADNNEELISYIQRAASKFGHTERSFDEANPRLDLQLPGGQRLHAIQVVTPNPTVTIRCPIQEKITLTGLVERKMMDQSIAVFLLSAVLAKCNIIVAGGTGTGKTTMLRALLYEVPIDERLLVIEDTAELQIAHWQAPEYNIVEMETRDANAGGTGAFTMLDLTRECLRMSPDRVVLGEVRGAEALYMLKAMSQGNDGSMCSIHAESAEGTADRVRTYCAEGSSLLPLGVIDALYRNAVHLVVHISMIPDDERPGKKRRIVSHIVEVVKGTYAGNGTETTEYRNLFGKKVGKLAAVNDSDHEPSEALMERLSAAGCPPWEAFKSGEVAARRSKAR